MTLPSDIPGLVSWYTATAQYCFSDAAGTVPCADGDLVQVWKDRQGTNNLSQATSTLRPTFRKSQAVTWLDFDGSRYIDSATPWFTATPGSMTVWVWQNIVTGSTPITVGVSGSTNNLFRLTTNTNTLAPVATAVNNGGTSGAALSTGSGPISAWFHIAGTYTGDTLRNSYRNGSGKGTNSTNTVPTGASINLGRVGANVSAASILNGRIAEVAIWNQAISDDSVTLLFGTGNPPTIPASDGKSF